MNTRENLMQFEINWKVALPDAYKWHVMVKVMPEKDSWNYAIHPIGYHFVGRMHAGEQVH